jgi:hypothetical protein
MGFECPGVCGSAGKRVISELRLPGSAPVYLPGEAAGVKMKPGNRLNTVAGGSGGIPAEVGTHFGPGLP